MVSINKVILIGRLGKDPEIRMLSSSKQVANFSLATSNVWNDRETGEKKESTEWHNIVVYKENLVSLVQKYIKKGFLLYIEGTLKTRKWLDNSNNNRYITEVVLNNTGDIKILENKDLPKNRTTEVDNVNNHNKKDNETYDTSAVKIDDEIPF